MALYLGVDGGNTKTVALVADEAGHVIGFGRTSGSDIYAADTEEDAIDEVALAVDAALAAAGAKRSDLASAAFGLAGADWPEDFLLLDSAFRARGFGRHLVVVNDAIGALRAGSPTGFGVVLVAGSGMAIAARSPEDRVWHSSNWPTACGGAGLGEAAIDAIFREHLDVGPATALTPMVLERTGTSSAEDLLHLLTARGKRRWVLCDYARLAPIVLTAAEHGDAVATEIVASCAEMIGTHAVAAAHRVGLGPDPFPLVLCGGVFRRPLLREHPMMLGKIQAAFPGIVPIHSTLEPAAGALLLAFDGEHPGRGEQVRDQIRHTMPSPSVFATEPDC